MDLWIRSQDKHQLIKVDSIGLTYDNGQASRIVCYENSRTWVVARYRKEERVLEVLDEIQRILVYGLIDTQRAKANGSISLTNPNCIVYEMPEE